MPKRQHSKRETVPVSAASQGTKAQRVFLDLRSRILAGEIDSSSRLTLRPLANHYGTGINTVSEAVKALASEGLVELEGQAGARVVARDLNRIRGEYILRIAIECESARRCAVNVDEIQMAALERMATKVDRLFEEGVHLAECRQADIQFHLALAEFSGAVPLKDALTPLVDRLVVLDQTERASAEIPGQKHLEVFEAIRSRQPDRAGDMMRRHLEHSMSVSLALLYC